MIKEVKKQMLSEDITERAYRMGKLPLRIYCQLNGKTPAENYEL